MATNVFYNFPQMTVNIPSSSTNYYQSNAIQIASPADSMPVPNIQYNSVNYFATMLYVCSNGGKNYLIVNCVDDLNSPRNYCFFIAELKGDSSSAVDLDGIFSGGNTNFTLNNRIKQNDSVIISGVKNNCVTILANTPISVQKTDISSSLSPPNNFVLPSSSNGGTTGQLTQNEMEWNMHCAIVYDDASQNTMQSSSIDTNSALTLFLTSLMIAGGAYTLAPALYSKMYEKTNSEAVGVPGAVTYAALNGHWGLTMVSAALVSIIVGAVNKKQIFYFVAITLCITFLAASQAVKAKLTDQGKTSILSAEGTAFDIVSRFGDHQLSTPLYVIFFCSMAALGLSPIPNNTDVFNAMLISFMLCATGLSCWKPEYKGHLPNVTFVFTCLAIILSILWPTISAITHSASAS